MGCEARYTAAEVVAAIEVEKRTTMSEQVSEPFDLDLLESAGLREWVSFSVRYGYQKVSHWVAKTETWAAVPGRLWELIADQEGTP